MPGQPGAAILVSPRFHPLKVYAAIEIGIGVLGIAILWVLPYAGGLYTALGSPGSSGISCAGWSAACCSCRDHADGRDAAVGRALLEASPRGISWLGILYTGNIAGAVFGCLFAGFYLLRLHDMAVATYAAAAINGAIGLIALLLARAIPYRAASAEPKATAPALTPIAWAVYGTIALRASPRSARKWSGPVAVADPRPLGLYLLDILAVFWSASASGRDGRGARARPQRPAPELGLSQLLLVAAIAWTAVLIGSALPWWPINPQLSSSPWFNFQLDLVRCMVAILRPRACGRELPAGARAAARREDPASWSAASMPRNTVGAILGALGFSLSPSPGSARAAPSSSLIAWRRSPASLHGGALFLEPFHRAAPCAARSRASPALEARSPWRSPRHDGLLLARNLPPLPAKPCLWPQLRPGGAPEILYVGEGFNASVAVSRRSDGVLAFHCERQGRGSTAESDMRLQRMLGHISAILHPRPRTVLIVGLGAGVTAGSFVLHPDVERIVICEIEPLIPQRSRLFRQGEYDVLNDRASPSSTTTRGTLAHHQGEVRIITSDPIHPWVKGAATLYTREYFELARNHLNPGGVITQWVPLYESSLAAVKSEMATFFGVFPDGAIWANDENAEGYDVVIFARKEPRHRPSKPCGAGSTAHDHARVKASLAEVGLGSMNELLSTYCRPRARTARVAQGRRDQHRHQSAASYLAGFGSNLYNQDLIFQDMLRAIAASPTTCSSAPIAPSGPCARPWNSG